MIKTDLQKALARHGITLKVWHGHDRYTATIKSGNIEMTYTESPVVGSSEHYILCQFMAGIPYGPVENWTEAQNLAVRQLNERLLSVFHDPEYRRGHYL